MALISPETLQRLRQGPLYNNNDVTTQLDAAMKNVLNTNLSIHEKWALYQETLQRYLHFKKQEREPINIPIIQDARVELNQQGVAQQDEATSDNNVLNMLNSIPVVTQQDEAASDNNVLNMLNSIPRLYRDKANSLLARLSSAKGIITWSNDGMVSINNNLIPNSNIADLIGDVIRYRKHSNPVGWREFTTVLKKLNIPHELIGNQARRQYISKPSVTPTTTTTTTATTSGMSNRKRRGSRRRLLMSDTYDADTGRAVTASPKVSWKRFSL